MTDPVYRTVSDSDGNEYPAMKTHMAPELGVRELWADPVTFIRAVADLNPEPWQEEAMRRLAQYYVAEPQTEGGIRWGRHVIIGTFPKTPWWRRILNRLRFWG